MHDLLTTVNKPEWPATELLLSLLGTMLVSSDDVLYIVDFIYKTIFGVGSDLRVV